MPEWWSASSAASVCAGLRDEWQASMTVVIPAFMVSELGTSFRMGLYLFIPMLLIDVLIASVLMSLGMMMVPPQMISLPLKIGVFLLAGGWHLVVSSLVKSFG